MFKKTLLYVVMAALLTLGCITLPANYAYATDDMTPPIMTSASPTSGATGIARSSAIVLTFSEPIFFSDGSRTNPGSAVVITINGSSCYGYIATISNNVMTITPTGNWVSASDGSTLELKVTAGKIYDASGNPSNENFRLGFNFIDLTGPVVGLTTPASGTSNVPYATQVKISYNENIKAAAAYNNITVTRNGGAALQITKSISGNTLTISPVGGVWDSGTGGKYTVTIPEGAVSDAFNNIVTTDTVVNFSTNDIKPPTAVSSVPANGTTGVLDSTTFQINFDEDILVSDYSLITVTCSNPSNTNLSNIYIYTRKNTLYIEPPFGSWDNSCGYKYTVTIQPGAIQDIKVNRLNTTLKYTFTTKDNTPPEVQKTSPGQNATGVSLSAAITINYNKAIRAASAYANIKVLDSLNKVIPINKSISGSTLTITAVGGKWSHTKTYRVILPKYALKSAAGVTTDAFTLTFTTVDMTPPTVAGFAPALNATNQLPTLAAYVKYSEPILAGANYAKITATCDGKPVALTKTISGAVLNLKPVGGWLSSKSYVITVPAGATKDKAGNACAAVTTLKFKMAPPAVKLSITKTSPASAALRGTATKIYYSIDKKCNLKLEILDSKGNVKRVINKAGVAAGTGYLSWDGFANGHANMPYGKCSFRLTATPVDLTKAAVSQKSVSYMLKAKAAIAITDHIDSWDYDHVYYMSTYFSLNTTGKVTYKIYKSTTLKFTWSSDFDDVNGEGAKYPCCIHWNGVLANGQYLSDGKYKCVITVNNGVSSASASFTFTVY